LRTLILRRHGPSSHSLLVRLWENDPTELKLEIQNSRIRMHLERHMPGLWCHVRVDITHNFRSRIKDPGSKYHSWSLSTNHPLSPQQTCLVGSAAFDIAKLPIPHLISDANGVVFITVLRPAPFPPLVTVCGAHSIQPIPEVPMLAPSKDG
jgi:hypothetical protein